MGRPHEPELLGVSGLGLVAVRERSGFVNYCLELSLLEKFDSARIEMIKF
jgi:hypothetical protein